MSEIPATNGISAPDPGNMDNSIDGIPAPVIPVYMDTSADEITAPIGSTDLVSSSVPNANGFQDTPIKLLNKVTKSSKRKQAANVKKLTVVKKENGKKAEGTSRARNWTNTEISLLVKEAGNHFKVLKGRHGPGVTNQKKEVIWKLLATRINTVNGHNDRTWDQCRRKHQDLESSTRTKARAQEVEKKRTGGGKSRAPVFTEAEEIAMAHIPDSVIRGLDCGLDSNVGESESYRDSQISFDRPEITRLYFADETVNGVAEPSCSTQQDLFGSDDNDDEGADKLLRAIDETINAGQSYIPRSPVQSAADESIPADHVIAPETPRQAAPRATSTPLSTALMALPRQCSNRTVTRDLRRSEYKEMMREHQKTNSILEQLLEVERLKLRMKYPDHQFQFKPIGNK